MKRFILALLIGAALAAGLWSLGAFALPIRKGVISSVNAAAFDGGAGQKYWLQCPNQGVYVRPGCPVGCLADAGSGDITYEFVANTDPVIVQLTQTQDRFWVRSTDGGTTICNVYQDNL